MIDGVLRTGVTSKKWLEHKDGEAVHQFLTEWRDSVLRKLALGTGDELLRSQGRLEVLDRILNMPQEIRQYQDNVRNKKVEPVTRAGLTLNRK